MKIRMHVLVVEDDPYMQALLRYLLDSRFDLELVERIDDALSVAARQHFDLFVLDIDLREQRTGIELLGDLRRMAAYAATPAVACTAYGRDSDGDRFRSQGFDSHIGKPFTSEQLYKTIETTLARGPGLATAA